MRYDPSGSFRGRRRSTGVTVGRVPTTGNVTHSGVTAREWAICERRLMRPGVTLGETRLRLPFTGVRSTRGSLDGRSRDLAGCESLAPSFSGSR